jgi:glutaredoxin 3
MNIVMYTKSSCPNCVSAKMILQLCKLDFVEVDAELGNRWENLLKEFPDARQMPQIFIDDQRVGGVAGLKTALKQLGKML